MTNPKPLRCRRHSFIVLSNTVTIAMTIAMTHPRSLVPLVRRSICRAARQAPSRHLITAASVATHVRNLHTTRSSVFSSSSVSPISPSRPSLSARNSVPRSLASQKRTIFIQTQDTPNQDALKFLPSSRVLPENFPSPFLEYLSPRSTLAPPHPSPLAAQLLGVDGVTAVFYGPEYITVTKSSDVPWAHVKPEVFALITEAVTSGATIVETRSSNSATSADPDAEQAGGYVDTLTAHEDDDEVVAMIKELLETRIRPAIQEDGGDIDFRGFEDGNVLLKLRGACRTCDSSTVTLKNGIENMLMHYIEEVKGVVQVLDEEEEVALKEFERFEEKLKVQRGKTPASAAIDAAA